MNLNLLNKSSLLPFALGLTVGAIVGLQALVLLALVAGAGYYLYTKKTKTTL